MTGRLRPQQHSDDGSGVITLFFVVLAVMFFLTVGLVVDGGGKVQALRRAQATAAEAARAGAQAVQIPLAVRGTALRLDPVAARAAARRYLTDAGVPGDVVVVDATTVRVTTQVPYQPVFLQFMGTMTLNGSAEARITQN